MHIGQYVDEKKYAGAWLHQRTGSFADSATGCENLEDVPAESYSRSAVTTAGGPR